MNELEFKRLIERYQQGLLSAREKALVDKWFDELDQRNVKGSWSDADRLRLKNKILKQINTHGELPYSYSYSRSSSARSIFKARSLRYALRATACILLIGALSYPFWKETEQKPNEIPVVKVSSYSEIKKAILPDGSIVWLRGTSTLTYPQTFTGDERRVTLRGEALFEVTRDTQRPFVLQCGELVTTVLGTSFNIKASENDIEVLVLTGKVSVSSENDKMGLIILPNEKAVYSKEQKHISKINMEEDSVKKEAITALSSGTLYIMDFHDTPMEEVIRRIEGKFDVKIETPDPTVRNCVITADFTGQSLELTLAMISQALGFKYEIERGKVILQGQGCKTGE